MSATETVLASEVDQGLEVWRNASRGTVYLRRIGERGSLISFKVGGGRRFTISPQERRINSESVASPKQDWFRNGTFTPIRLIEGERDTKELEKSPNVLSDVAMKALLKTPRATLVPRLAEITNANTLIRLLEIAKAQDVKTSVLAAVTERLSEVQPAAVIEVTTTEVTEPSKQMKPVTPQ